MVCAASLSLARAVLRSSCASAARARSSRASPRCSASSPGSASALSRSSAALPGWSAAIHKLPAAAHMRAVLGSLVGRGLGGFLEGLRGGFRSPRFCASSARQTSASGVTRSGQAAAAAARRRQGRRQARIIGGSSKAATVRRIASISCGSDRRWPPPLITFSWTSAERSARIAGRRRRAAHPVVLAVDSRTGQSIAISLVEQQQLLAGFPEAAERDALRRSAACAIGETPFGEVGRRGDADERRDALGPQQREVQRDPAAHRRADEDQRAASAGRSRERFLEPERERPVLEAAAARPVPNNRSAASRGRAPAKRRARAPCALHVRRVAGQEHQIGERRAAIGDAPSRPRRRSSDPSRTSRSRTRGTRVDR